MLLKKGQSSYSGEALCLQSNCFLYSRFGVSDGHRAKLLRLAWVATAEAPQDPENASNGQALETIASSPLPAQGLGLKTKDQRMEDLPSSESPGFSTRKSSLLYDISFRFAFALNSSLFILLAQTHLLYISLTAKYFLD